MIGSYEGMISLPEYNLFILTTKIITFYIS